MKLSASLNGDVEHPLHRIYVTVNSCIVQGTFTETNRRQAQSTAKSSVTSEMPRTVTLTHSHGQHRTWAWDDHPSAFMYHPKINCSVWKGVRSIQSAQMSIQSSICDQYSYMRIHLPPNYTTRASQLRSKPLIFPRQLK